MLTPSLRTIQVLNADADSVGMECPTVEQFGADVEPLQRDTLMWWDDPEATLEQLAKLQQLAVYLNAHLLGPVIPQV